MKQVFADKSILYLLLINIITIIIAFIENWNIIILMYIYWFQSIIIGAFNFIELFKLESYTTKGFKINNHEVEPTKDTKMSTAFFFLFHFNFFHFVYAIFLIVIPFIILSDEQLSATFLMLVKDFYFIILTIILFFINQFFSYKHNHPRIRKDINIGTLMFYPYARIIPMHFTIIASFFLSEQINFSNYSTEKLILLFFLLLKTVADIIMQYIENNKLRINT